MALVFYHRGHLAKPEMDAFRLGIQKASEAIENSIGDPTAHKLKVPVVLSTEHRAQTAHKSPQKQARKLDASSASPKKQAAQSGTPHSAKPARPSGSADASAKSLLGELYADKEYLQKLFEDKGTVSLCSVSLPLF